MAAAFPTSSNPALPEALERKYREAEPYKPLRFDRKRAVGRWLMALGGAAVVTLAVTYALRNRRTLLPNVRNLMDDLPDLRAYLRELPDVPDWSELRAHLRDLLNYIPSRG